MERFDTLLEATEFAATLCKNWTFATSNDRYDVKGLMVLAETSDSENPIDEDCFYVVSPAGAIGLCEDGEDIDWLFLTGSSTDEDLPITLQTAWQIKFCSKCGNGVILGARFCGACGAKLN
ncbi:MAG: zinc-ribbon domain-containing protein [Clostridia bacterium]|nr:zinc-ribbon domain-containing protein [Clostridiales bacterium]